MRQACVCERQACVSDKRGETSVCVGHTCDFSSSEDFLEEFLQFQNQPKSFNFRGIPSILEDFSVWNLRM